MIDVLSFLQRNMFCWRRKSHFSTMIDEYISRISLQGSLSGVPARAPKVGILVSPWMQTPVPLFNVEIAFELQRRGCDVSLIVDCKDVFANITWPEESDEIHRLIRSLRGRFQIHDLNDQDSSNCASPNPALENLISENAVRLAQGETRAVDFLTNRSRDGGRSLRKHYGVVRSFLAGNKFDWLLVPGGVWVSSGVFCMAAEDLGIDYTTYDSGNGSLWFATRGVAAHSHDLRAVLASVVARKGDLEGVWESMLQTAQNRLRQRMEGKDEWNLQLTPAGSSDDLKFDIFVPLNSRWDAAALMRNKLFHSVGAWLQFLAEYVAKRPHLTMAVRQHPGERYPGFEAGDDWNSILTTKGDAGGRIRFFSADSAVNSYDIAKAASVVLPFTSRIGIEAAMLGKPVVVSSLCFYGDSGFCHEADTLYDYEQLIDRAVSGELSLDREAVDLAGIAYFIIEYCMELKTPFTPMPQDYKRWINISPSELWKNQETSMIADSLIKRTPIGLANFHRLFASSEA